MSQAAAIGHESADSWPAERLTELAVQWLRKQRPDALIVPEFVCGAMGAARIDLAAITKDGIFGVEVKGDGDSHKRLSSQGPLFSAVCSTVHLLPAPSLLQNMRKHRPPHWAIVRVEDGGLVGEWGFRTYSEYYLAPQVLLNCLWSEELRRVCSRLRVGCGKKATVMDMVREITALVPLRDIKTAVCDTLLQRQWTNWTSASGETRRLYRPGEGESPSP